MRCQDLKRGALRSQTCHADRFIEILRLHPRQAHGPAQAAAPREEAVACEWPGVRTRDRTARRKAASNEREYWHFCLNHVREYNQTYNFFSGHECRRGRALSEGCADRPSPDLEDGRQCGTKGKARPAIDLRAWPIRSACSANSTAADAGVRVRAGPKPNPRRARSSMPSARRCR